MRRLNQLALLFALLIIVGPSAIARGTNSPGAPVKSTVYWSGLSDSATSISVTEPFLRSLITTASLTGTSTTQFAVRNGNNILVGTEVINGQVSVFIPAHGDFRVYDAAADDFVLRATSTSLLLNLPTLVQGDMDVNGDISADNFPSDLSGYALKASDNNFATTQTMTGVVAARARVTTLTLSGLTASTVPYVDAYKRLASSSVTPTELGYVHNTTGSVQTQLNYLLGLIGTGGGGGAVWGAITGMLSGQTDLQGALDAKVPTTRTVNGHALSSNVTVTPTDLSLVIGTNTEAWDADLDYLAGFTPAANVKSIFNAADYSAVRTLLGLVPGTNVQAYDATLAAVAAYNTNGIVTQTAADTFTGRTLTGTANQITVTNGSGAAGNPTISLPSAIVIDALQADTGVATNLVQSVSSDDDLVLTAHDGDMVLTLSGSSFSFSGSPITSAVWNGDPILDSYVNSASAWNAKQAGDSDLTAAAAQSTSGFVSRNNTGPAWNPRTLTGTTNRLTVSNGTGTGGDPVFDISASYVGQSSINALGTIGTGTWQGTTIGTAYGGTGSTSGNVMKETITFNIGNNITVVPVGDVFVSHRRYAYTINSVTINAKQSGSIVIDIGKVARGSWAGSFTGSITGAALPTLSSAFSSQDTTLTGWTTSVSADYDLLFTVISSSGVRFVTCTVEITKS